MISTKEKKIAKLETTLNKKIIEVQEQELKDLKNKSNARIPKSSKNKAIVYSKNQKKSVNIPVISILIIAVIIIFSLIIVIKYFK